MRELFPQLLGNEKIKNILSPVFVPGGAPNHAYIIEGPAGSGKNTLAVQFSAALCCDSRTGTGPLPCGICPSCRKILRGISPDVISIGTGDKTSIGVDAVRDLRTDVHIYPNEQEYKIYLIKDADTMTAQAQNAFLLTLEEPPSYAVFLLLCENSGLLLETVRSRAPVLRMQPLDPSLTEQALIMVYPAAAGIKKNDPSRFSAAVMASSGSVGKALELLDSKAGEEAAALRSAVARFLSLCADRGSGPAAMGEIVSSCGSSRDRTAAHLSSCSLAIRDLILLKKDPGVQLMFYSDREEASSLSERFPIRRLLSLSDSVSDAISAVGRGMNIRLTLMSMLSRANII